MNKSFSVIPVNAAAQASMNIKIPKLTCTGKYIARIRRIKPGNRKVTNPATH